MSVQQTPPSTENYSVGKGKLYAAAWSGTTPPSSYDAMGNCPSIEVELTIERLPHYSQQQDFKLRDANPPTQTEYKVTFTCDEMAAVNLNKFLMGSVSGNVVSAMQNADANYALKFVSNNPVGPNQTWEFWKATITPSGPLALIGDDWMVMSFMADGLADTANHASTPYFDVTYSSSSSSSSSRSSSSSSSAST